MERARFCYCIRCGTRWNVSTLATIRDDEYICPICTEKERLRYGDAIAQRLVRCRVERHMACQTVAELCGISKGTLWAYEHGKQTPKSDTLAILADFYHVSVDWLVGRG